MYKFRAVAAANVRERLAWEITPELYDKIRNLWIKHSKAEDARDLQGLTSVVDRREHLPEGSTVILREVEARTAA